MEREGREVEREGKGDMRKRGRREGGEKRKGILIGGMVLGLLMGCNNGIAELEKRNTFFDSVIKIGHEFQEIFGNFGNTMGEALGFNFIKPEDNRSKVGEHFKNLGDGLKNTKGQLEELSKKIIAIPHTDTKSVETVITGAREVIENLIGSVKKLAGAAGDTPIGDCHSSAVAANKVGVTAVIEGVGTIVDTAKKFGVNIEGKDGAKVGNTNGPKLLVHNSDASSDAAKLAAEVAKADPWAMIDKIKNAKTEGTAVDVVAEVGALALGGGGSANSSGTAATNADLAAAVALKAMTKDGKFSATSDTDGVVKGAAASAVNKVLGILDEIIRRIVAKNLEKVREAVKGIQYSENTGTETTEAKK